jgi:hypothetical protein
MVIAWISGYYLYKKGLLLKHYRNLFSTVLAAHVYESGIFYSLMMQSHRYWPHDTSLLLPPLCPTSSPLSFNLSFLGHTDNLHYLKIIAYTQVIMHLLSKCQMNITLQFSFNYPDSYFTSKYGEKGSIRAESRVGGGSGSCSPDAPRP